MGWIIEIHQQSIPWIVDGFGLWRNGDKGGTTNLKGGGMHWKVCGGSIP